MKRGLILFVLLFSGCAFNGHLVRKCPGNSRLVTIEESKSSNAYLAQASEDARTLAKCAQLDLEEKLEESKNEQ